MKLLFIIALLHMITSCGKDKPEITVSQKVTEHRPQEKDLKKSGNAIVNENEFFNLKSVEREIAEQGEILVDILYSTENADYASALTNFLTGNNAKIIFNNKKFGLLQSKLSLSLLDKLYQNRENFGPTKSFFVQPAFVPSSKTVESDYLSKSYHSKSSASLASDVAALKLIGKKQLGVELEGKGHSIISLNNLEAGKSPYRHILKDVALTETNTKAGLARVLVSAAEVGVDVVDLGIPLPEWNRKNHLLSELACRIVQKTNTVIVVSATLNEKATIGGLVQSPCVLAVGTAFGSNNHRSKIGRGRVSFGFRNKLYTAPFSARGTTESGILKPDIVSPTLAYKGQAPSLSGKDLAREASAATSSLIVMLKQAFLKMGHQLDFTQVKFLLQGSSLETKDIFDGYGYLDLMQAFQNGRDFLDDQTLHPALLGNHKKIEISEFPQSKYLNLSVIRRNVISNDRKEMPLKFSIEFYGEVDDWISFVDDSSFFTSYSIDTVAKNVGSIIPLKLKFDLSREEYQNLRPGRYVALIKGIREDIGGSRYVDYLMPIVLIKAFEGNTTLVKIESLKDLEQQHIFIPGKSNDRLRVKLITNCKTTDSEKLSLKVHGDIFDNNTPFWVASENGLNHLIIQSEGENKCLKGENSYVSVQRIAANIKAENEKIQLHKDQIRFEASLNLPDVFNSRHTHFEIKKTLVHLSKKLVGNQQLSFEEETSSVMIINRARSNARLKLQVFHLNKNGKLKQQWPQTTELVLKSSEVQKVEIENIEVGDQLIVLSGNQKQEYELLISRPIKLNMISKKYDSTLEFLALAPSTVNKWNQYFDSYSFSVEFAFNSDSLFFVGESVSIDKLPFYNFLYKTLWMSF